MNTSVTCYDRNGSPLEELVQWDINVTIQVGGADTTSAPNFHFCQKGRDMAYVVPSTVKSGKLEATIPNLLLQSKYPLVVFLYYTVAGEQRSKYEFQIPIIPRDMPMEYAYEENIGYESWIQMTEEARRIIEASETLDRRIQESNDILAEMDADVKAAKTAETNAAKHEQGARQALTDATAQKTAAAQSATNANASKVAAAGSEAKAKEYADAAAKDLEQTTADKDAADSSAAAAKKSEQDAAKHLADALAAKQGAEAAKDGADEALEQATQKAEEASGYADTARQYSGNPAIPKNGTWWIWNAENSAYEDTGKRAVLKPDIVYTSVEKMNADTSQELNTLAIISTEVNVEDNAKVYIWDDEAWQFLADLSGFTGVGIESITQISGNHAPGSTDVFRITLDDGRTFDYGVYNGHDNITVTVEDDDGGNVIVTFNAAGGE